MRFIDKKTNLIGLSGKYIWASVYHVNHLVCSMYLHWKEPKLWGRVTDDRTFIFGVNF